MTSFLGKLIELPAHEARSLPMPATSMFVYRLKGTASVIVELNGPALRFSRQYDKNINVNLLRDIHDNAMCPISWSFMTCVVN